MAMVGESAWRPEWFGFAGTRGRAHRDRGQLKVCFACNRLLRCYPAICMPIPALVHPNFRGQSAPILAPTVVRHE